MQIMEGHPARKQQNQQHSTPALSPFFLEGPNLCLPSLPTSPASTLHFQLSSSSDMGMSD